MASTYQGWLLQLCGKHGTQGTHGTHGTQGGRHKVHGMCTACVLHAQLQLHAHCMRAACTLHASCMLAIACALHCVQGWRWRWVILSGPVLYCLERREETQPQPKGKGKTFALDTMRVTPSQD